MNSKERLYITMVLLVIFVTMAFDISTDWLEGARWWHVLFESIIAVAVAVGMFFLLRGTLGLKKSLETERKISSKMKDEAEKWQEKSKMYVEGLNKAIEDQLTDWKLTDSEREVAFLLLKGLSLKDVAEVRKTAERTARAQSISVYSKAGLAGRSELSAFFLEDLFMPSE